MWDNQPETVSRRGRGQGQRGSSSDEPVGSISRARSAKSRRGRQKRSAPEPISGEQPATVPGMRALHYPTVHEDLIAAFPELSAPYERLFADWDNFEGQPPGQYLVFSGTIGTLLEILLALPASTLGRDALLQRAFAFLEAMLASDDAELGNLAIDQLEGIDGSGEAAAAVDLWGGSHIQQWWQDHASPGTRPANHDVNDLFGVRAAIAPLLPGVPAAQIPGISYPILAPELASLAEAQGVTDGTVLLSGYDTSYLYVVIRAEQVLVSESQLGEAAKAAAKLVGQWGSSPEAQFRRIPEGERVWNMNVGGEGGEQHTRLTARPWVLGQLAADDDPFVRFLRGQTPELTLPKRRFWQR
jgi:hypothetical protein